MKISVAKLRETIRRVLKEMHDESPLTMRSPDTSRFLDPDTLVMMGDDAPETEMSPGTLASPGAEFDVSFDDEDEHSAETVVKDPFDMMADTIASPRTSMRALGLGRQGPDTVRSPRTRTR